LKASKSILDKGSTPFSSTITALESVKRSGLVHHIPLIESMYRPECCYDGGVFGFDRVQVVMLEDRQKFEAVRIGGKFHTRSKKTKSINANDSVYAMAA
jgi:hypothetical protein